MDNIKEYVDSKIKKNSLPIDLDKTLDIINQLNDGGMYNKYTLQQIFYQYILNLAGNIIAKIDIDISECFGYLKPKESFKSKNIIYYEFFTEEDYYEWLNNRKTIYDKITNYDDIRLLNFVEMCTINFNTDISTNTEYEILDKTLKLVENINKTGGIIENKTGTFITYIVEQFYKNNVYKVV